MADWRKLHERVLALAEGAEKVTGESCPRMPAHPCNVGEWVYEMESIHPRMYGICEQCGTVYVFVLGRNAYRGESVAAGTFDRALENRGEYGEITRPLRVIDAAERVLMGSGNAQRLPFLLSEHRISITREIIHALRLDAMEQVEEYRHRVDELVRELHQRIVAVDKERARLSARVLKGKAKEAADELARLRERIKAERAEAGQLRRAIRELSREIQAAWDDAHRQPLPVPENYEPPALDARTVLCDAIQPSEVIYALVDPADPELVRYVGRTNDPTHRYRGHCTNGSDAVQAWAQSVMAEGRRPAMVLIERCEADAVAGREAYWIHHYRKLFQADLNRSIPRLEVVA